MSDILVRLWQWTPMLAEGFAMNVAISVSAMACGTLIGLFVGLGRLSAARPVRALCGGATHLLRNTPSIVLLFYLALILPAELHLAGLAIPLPAWAKAIVGLSMPVIGFMSDATYGAVRAVPALQWDAAACLPLGRLRTYADVVLPQTMPLLLPPWASYFAIILMASSTAALVGVEEILSRATVAMEADPDPAFIIPVYFYVLLWFFAFCYPVSRLTHRLGRRAWR